jgi:hypothetical protein
MKKLIIGILWILVTSFTGLDRDVYAQKITYDIETDPIAFALNGYSLHGGILWDSFRFDVGVFGIEVPESFHGNSGFTNRIDGAGLKLDYYLMRPGAGWFAGVEGGIVRNRVTLDETNRDKSRIVYSTGVRTGYRFVIADRFTITPWVGLGYSLNARDTRIGDQIFETMALVPFPTVHIGYRF